MSRVSPIKRESRKSSDLVRDQGDWNSGSVATKTLKIAWFNWYKRATCSSYSTAWVEAQRNPYLVMTLAACFQPANDPANNSSRTQAAVESSGTEDRGTTCGNPGTTPSTGQDPAWIMKKSNRRRATDRLGVEGPKNPSLLGVSIKVAATGPALPTRKVYTDHEGYVQKIQAVANRMHRMQWPSQWYETQRNPRLDWVP